jgi:hypothetical protein
MPLQYHVISLAGNDISKLLEELMKQVTAKINTGATLVGGINITMLVANELHETRLLVSQAVTYKIGSLYFVTSKS